MSRFRQVLALVGWISLTIDVNLRRQWWLIAVHTALVLYTSWGLYKSCKRDDRARTPLIVVIQK